MTSPTEPQLNPELDPLVPAPETDRRYGMPHKALLRLSRLGAFPFVKLGARVYFLESDLLRAKREGVSLHPDQPVQPVTPRRRNRRAV